MATTSTESEGTPSSLTAAKRTASSSRLDKLLHRSNHSTTATTAPTNGVTSHIDTSPNRTPGSSTQHSPVIGASLTKSASPIEALPPPAIAQPAPHKPSMSAQLQRMFSRSGKMRDSSATPSTAGTPTSSTPVNGEKRPSTERQPSIIPGKKSSISEESSKQFEKKGSVAEGSKPSPAVNGKDNQKDSALKRFELHPDGTHTHQLKSAKRQEKLTGMFRDLLLGKKRDDAVEADGLGLVSTWVDQLKADKDKLATDKTGGPNSTATLVEKYGKCQEVVGRGAFGIVRISHKVDPKNEGKELLYAVKEFRRRPQESAKKYNKRLTSEFCISSSLRHPNVIHTLDLLQDAKGDYCEVMEYCAGGDLYTLILAAGKLEVAEADCYFKQLMRGVEYMHEMGVAHRDLKPENLLLTSRGSLKITDFGNGECFRMAWEKEAHKTCGLCGSGPYISPEEYTEKEFDPRAVDVWATGVIYMAMRTGRHLWRIAKRDEDEFFEKYLEGRKDEGGYGPIESLHRARCRNVIYSILDPNPTRRITASQVLKSEWGREIRVCEAGEEGF